MTKQLTAKQRRRKNGAEFRIPPYLDEEISEIFTYQRNITHQNRCHDYCRRREILRDANTAATLATVRDLVGRAYNSGRSDMANEIARNARGE